MGITLDQLIYDATDGGSQVGSHTLAGTDGTAIGHVGDALKVDIGSVTDLDIRDLDASQDNVAISDGTDTLAVNADGSINSVVTATDLDIRDLTAASDSVAAWMSDGSGNALTSTAGSLDVNLTNSSIDVNFAAPSNPKTSTVTATTTAGEIAATPLANRTRILVQNRGNKSVFFGESNSVTASNGVEIPRGASMELPYGPSANIFAITSSGTADLRVLELD